MNANPLRRARIRLGLRQVDVAADWSISKGLVSLWERGEHHPQPRHMKKIAKLLGLSENEALRAWLRWSLSVESPRLGGGVLPRGFRGERQTAPSPRRHRLGRSAKPRAVASA